MARIEVRDLVLEVDVVLTGVREGRGLEHRLHLRDAAPERLAPDEPLEVEHAGSVQLLPAMHEECPPPCAVKSVQGEAVEVEKLVHVHGGPFVPRAVHASPGHRGSVVVPLQVLPLLEPRIAPPDGDASSLHLVSREEPSIRIAADRGPCPREGRARRASRSGKSG